MKNNAINSRSSMVWTFLRVGALMPMLCLCLTIPAAVAEADEGPSTGTAEVTVVNINSADAETLANALQGVGESRAAAIVEWRQANGSFTSIDELVEVKGIGEATVDKNRHKLGL